jgi:diaminopimelate epimerase
MNIAFNKYEGAGNDFIIIDNRMGLINPDDINLINKLCDRHFGIGADGLILVSNSENDDFEMKYFNADGKLGSMCGNGGRCVAHFSRKNGIAGDEQKYLAFDGIHKAFVSGGIVRLQMADVNDYKIINENYFLNTGSPHYVVFTRDVEKIDVFNEGKKLRWASAFAPGGTNVNFVEIIDNVLNLRTFERGVEDETLACGTGITASAIASVLSGRFVSAPVNVKARGGDLKVEFNVIGGKVTNVWLTGPATFVFEGIINI